jgi:hypothetical protein
VLDYHFAGADRHLDLAQRRHADALTFHPDFSARRRVDAEGSGRQRDGVRGVLARADTNPYLASKAVPLVDQLDIVAACGQHEPAILGAADVMAVGGDFERNAREYRQESNRQRVCRWRAGSGSL